MQTHIEFTRDLVTHFSQWCSSLKVDTVDDLCDLVVLEQFQNSVPSHIAVYISDHKVKTAAKLEDEYVLTHRGGLECHTRDDFGYSGEESASPRLGNGRSEWVARGQFDSTKICNHYKGKGWSPWGCTLHCQFRG